ncbi:LysR substrate-binding domain-containing protein [Synechococcus sp. BA-132 BA5]|uniref:LysR substrate-binding domain-containing protein n=1 Tax=Synechococcus sp. BA-132 BA5 TaxID=3110252 RepID=UPI002B210745|nr:LysR substrate-binding domain-containing protein [Synechococcus sp. BA-132 BA5]MEA5417225.1 LysR substrate-binding domain-containing protein [Synechococcus sp. BA-132 BA5]
MAVRQKFPPFAALRAFEAVVRLSSFKAAATELNVSPSAISHQIRSLEDALSCRLMKRDRNGVELTAHGERYAFAVLRGMERIAEATQELLSDAGECLTLQTYSTFAIRWLLPRLAGYEAATGQKPIRLVTSQRDVEFGVDAVDACIMIGHPGDPQSAYRPLFNSRVFPVASPVYLARNAPIETPADLRGHPLLQVYPSAGDWPAWLNAAGVTGLSTAGDGRFDSYDLALNAAVGGMGIALAIEPFAQVELESGRLVELFPGLRAPLPGNWYFVTPVTRRALEKVAAFEAWLVGEIKADPVLALLPDIRIGAA